MRSGRGETVAALAVVNAFGDVIGEDGSVLAGPRRRRRVELRRTAELIAAMQASPPDWTALEERNTTLVCVMTDAPLDKPACTRVARMASGGVARAVDPVFSDVDGDVVFCLASGEGSDGPLHPDRGGTIAATRDRGGDPRRCGRLTTRRRTNGDRRVPVEALRAAGRGAASSRWDGSSWCGSAG